MYESNADTTFHLLLTVASIHSMLAVFVVVVRRL